jgi:hypothetical protein
MSDSNVPIHAPIQNQVKLPLSVAFEVVAQSIRIRFGRSVVTITGVVFGIAFLMSILTSQVLKRGVAAEEALRIDTQRMASFLTAETGPIRGKTLVLWAGPALTPAESRLLQKLAAEGLAELRVTADTPLPPLPASLAISRTVAGEGASAVLVTCPALAPAEAAALLPGMRQPVFAFTGKADNLTLPPGVRAVSLSPPILPELQERLDREAAAARFRNGWIIAISLLVTVIGISNAMLISVTERFREIGTMKCLGALSSFIRTMFLIESGFMGLVGGLLGCLAGFAFATAAYTLTYGPGLISASLAQGGLTIFLYGLASLAAGLVLSVLAALYPAQVASNMVPAHALRSNI